MSAPGASRQVDESIAIRPAALDDAEPISELLDQLGFPATAEETRERLEHLLATGRDPVLVAARGDDVIGVLALHFTRMLLIPGPVARITTLVVHEKERSRGLGERLVAEADRMAREAGCSELELTTGAHMTRTHAFYERLGMGRSVKFRRRYGDGVAH
jgi:N-acetylglutamate synthase-like GNAT family acetyltransferase